MKTICFHHLVPPRESFGKGMDCRECVSEHENRKCKKYYPIKMKEAGDVNNGFLDKNVSSNVNKQLTKNPIRFIINLILGGK